MPNCRLDKWKNWFLASFFISMLWISIFSYVMVWMITIIGKLIVAVVYLPLFYVYLFYTLLSTVQLYFYWVLCVVEEGPCVSIMNAWLNKIVRKNKIVGLCVKSQVVKHKTNQNWAQLKKWLQCRFTRVTIYIFLKIRIQSYLTFVRYVTHISVHNILNNKNSSIFKYRTSVPLSHQLLLLACWRRVFSLKI